MKFPSIGTVLFFFLLSCHATRDDGASPPNESPRGEPHDRLSLAEECRIRDGDIILRRGTSLESDLIATFFAQSLNISHCAMIIRVTGQLLEKIPKSRIGFGDGVEGMLTVGDFVVIHSIQRSLSGVDGIQVQALRQFNSYSKEGTIIVVRPRMTMHQKGKYIGSIIARLGGTTTFDSSFDLNTEGNVYCSELFYLGFKDAGWIGRDDWTTTYGILSFSEFIDRDRFEVIIDHSQERTL
jgi:hypothetical protein